jgi:hypothetical protein
MTRAELIQIIKATRPADLLGAAALFAALFAALIFTGV